MFYFSIYSVCMISTLGLYQIAHIAEHSFSANNFCYSYHSSFCSFFLFAFSSANHFLSAAIAKQNASWYVKKLKSPAENENRFDSNRIPGIVWTSISGLAFKWCIKYNKHRECILYRKKVIRTEMSNYVFLLLFFFRNPLHDSLSATTTHHLSLSSVNS